MKKLSKQTMTDLLVEFSKKEMIELKETEVTETSLIEHVKQLKTGISYKCCYTKSRIKTNKVALVFKNAMKNDESFSYFVNNK